MAMSKWGKGLSYSSSQLAMFLLFACAFKRQLKKLLLLSLCWSLASSLQAWPAEAAEEAVEAGLGKLKERSKSKILSRLEAGARKALQWFPGGGAVGDLLLGSETAKSLAVQKEILATDQHILAKLRAMAQDALRVKRKLEAMDRLRRRAIRLGQTFSKTNYTKMMLGLTEEALGISVNPGDYIPNTAYTSKLKRNLSWSYSRDKGLFDSTKRFLKSSRKALSFKGGSCQDLRSFQRRLFKAAAYDRHVEEYVAARNVLLAQQHEQMAASLLRGNKELQAAIDHAEANMNVSERVQAQQVIDRNVWKALDHKQKAGALLAKNSQLSEADKAQLAAEEAYALGQELIAMELEVLQNRKSLSKGAGKSARRWPSYKQSGPGKRRKSSRASRKAP